MRLEGAVVEIPSGPLQNAKVSIHRVKCSGRLHAHRASVISVISAGLRSRRPSCCAPADLGYYRGEFGQALFTHGEVAEPEMLSPFQQVIGDLRGRPDQEVR